MKNKIIKDLVYEFVGNKEEAQMSEQLDNLKKKLTKVGRAESFNIHVRRILRRSREIVMEFHAPISMTSRLWMAHLICLIYLLLS